MAKAKVQSLLVDLELNSAVMRAGMAKAIAELHRFGREVKQVARTADEFGRVSKKLKQLSGDIAQLGAPLAAGIAGAMAAAAKVNPQVAAETEKLKRTMTTAANEVAKAFLPAFRELNQALSSIVGWFQRLSPETKQQMADWGVLVVQVTAGAFAFSKIAGAASALGEGAGIALRAVAALAPALPVILAVAAGLAGVVLIIGAAREAWDKNLLYIQDVAKAIADSLKAYVISSLANMLLMFEFVRGQVRPLLTLMRGLLAAAMAVGSNLGPMFNMDIAAKALGGLNKADQILGSEAPGLDQLKSLASAAADVGKDIGGSLAAGVKSTWNKGLETLGIDKLIAKAADFKNAIGGAMGGAGAADVPSGGSKPSAPPLVDAPPPPKDKKDKQIAMNDRLAATAAAVSSEFENLAERGIGLALSKLGAFGEVLGAAGSAFKGIKSAGGRNEEALMAGASAGMMVVVDKMLGFWDFIFQNAESLKRVQEIFGEIIQLVADAFSVAWEPLRTMAAVVLHFGKLIFEELKPTFAETATMIGAFIPNVVQLMTVALQMTKAFVAVTAIFGGGDGGLVHVAKFLFEAVKFWAVGTLTVAKGIVDTYNNILTVIGQMFRDLWMEETAQEVWGMRSGAASQGLGAALAAIEGLTWEQSNAIGENIKEQEKLAEAAKEASASLTNVPSGWKIQQAIYSSMHPGSGGGSGIPKFAAGGVVDRPTLAMVGEGGEREVIAPESMMRRIIREEGGGGGPVVININGITNPDAVARKVMEVMRRLNFQRTGSPIPAAPRFAGG